ncbi:hypothetical protein [Kitasatospora sp. GP82]|uniref:TolB family protein n=1 Tax=Kitasatospora sp. GP82 TaxID=3035089 RepID=UPI00247354B3|nr:hypothetical protein [Kitasatospora sp. GP82]MDH6123501.1 hypothetical protein [Kitasatospora sp. GP82]
MSARTRLRSAATIALTTVIATSAVALLSACDPTPTSKAGAGVPVNSAPATTGSTPSAPAATTPAPGGSASESASPSAAGTPTKAAPSATSPHEPTAPGTPSDLNGTESNGLTISNGTRYVLMNGASVDFGTIVRDLTWSPDGAKAAFIDGSGNLVASNPDGSGRVVVARNPGGQTWSHPTWQVAPAYGSNIPAKNNLIFAADKDGVSRLERVPATVVGGTPTTLGLEPPFDQEDKPLPQTGNVWPNANGGHGTALYANTGNGEVYIRDDYLRQQGGVMTEGSEPALSTDGEDVVFVRSVHGHDHLFEMRLGDRTAKDLTPNATTDYTEPAFSKDGRTIAARTPKGIVTVPANGSAAPKLISTHTGLPSFRR